MNKPVKDRTGIRYGRLTAKQYIDHGRWLCVCDCGKVVVVNGSHLTCGHTKSCGCIKHIHGETKTKLHSVWNEMLQRCENPSSPKYKDYGGRGIIVCEEWHEYTVFRDWAIRNGYNQAATYGMCTIERVDVNGNYTPDNCCWASYKVQARNRRSNHFVTVDGITKTLTDWCHIAGIAPSLFRYRKRKGFDDRDALFLPVRRR